MPNQTQRRYYLHRKIKAFASVRAYKRQVEIEATTYTELTPKRMAYLKELTSMGYNVQQIIPMQCEHKTAN